MTGRHLPPHKQIMEATGLSRARLAQIRKGTR